MKYRIERDGQSWAIAKEFTHTKTGVVTWRQIKWFGTLEQAADRLLDLCTVARVEGSPTNAELAAAVRVAVADVRSAIAELPHTLCRAG